MLLCPPKSRAGRRTVSIPAAIIPDIKAHLDKYTKRGDDAPVSTGIKGGPLRRSGFNKLTRWVDLLRTMGVPGLHFHDLPHTGNTLVAVRNLMARMGHDNERTALIYQHASNQADRKIAEGLNALVEGARRSDNGDGDEDDGTADVLARIC
jgi:integrase